LVDYFTVDKPLVDSYNICAAIYDQSLHVHIDHHIEIITTGPDTSTLIIPKMQV